MADEPLDLDQAISRVLDHARPLARETVPLGEPAVVVVVSAAHREEAFAAAAEAIDAIKAEAPIWKREVDGRESRWVEGRNPTDIEPLTEVRCRTAAEERR